MRAPNAFRNGTRSRRTSAHANVATSASLMPTIHASAITFELLDQRADFRNVLPAELAALGKVRDEGGDAPAVEAIEQALAFDVHVIGTLEQCAIEVAAAVTLG